MPRLKIRQWPLEGFINYGCQENLSHLPYTPRTLYPLPNMYLLACREKLRRLSACRLYSSPGGLLLSSSNGPPPSAKPVYPVMSSPLLRYHDDRVRRSPGALPLSFPVKVQAVDFCHKKRTRDLWNTRREIKIQTKLDQPSWKTGQHQTSETRP